MNKYQFITGYGALVVFLITSKYWEKVLYDNSQSPNIFDNALVLACYPLLYVIVMRNFVRINLFNDIIGCQIEIASHYRHNDIAYKECHCPMMIGLKYQYVACMLSYYTSNLEAFAWFF